MAWVLISARLRSDRPRAPNYSTHALSGSLTLASSPTVTAAAVALTVATSLARCPLRVPLKSQPWTVGPCHQGAAPWRDSDERPSARGGHVQWAPPQMLSSGQAERLGGTGQQSRQLAKLAAKVGSVNVTTPRAHPGGRPGRLGGRRPGGCCAQCAQRWHIGALCVALALAQMALHARQPPAASSNSHRDGGQTAVTCGVGRRVP